MIEDVKWLKPYDYAEKGGHKICWIAKDGLVIAGYFNMSNIELAFNYFDDVFSIKSVIPDGVCERKPGQQAPVLR